MTAPLSPTPRTTLRRNRQRAGHRRDDLYALIDACSIVHVAVVVGSAPTVLPMAIGRVGDRLYLHGARANALLGRGQSSEVCVCATALDGFVLARSAMHHSMNHRCAVVFGALRPVDSDEARSALVAIIDHALPHRSLECRPPSEAELKATMVVALDLDEASFKLRSGPPVDDEADLALPHWAGELRLRTAIEAMIPATSGDPSQAVCAAVLRHAPRLDGDTTVGSYVIDPDPTRLDLPLVLGWLRDESYWASDLDLERLLRSIQHSYAIGAYDDGGTQVGFARLVTDQTTFAWLADVFVAQPHRGRGLGTALTRWAVEHPAMASVRRIMLGTRDAHSLYRRFGFDGVDSERFLQRRRSA